MTDQTTNSYVNQYTPPVTLHVPPVSGLAPTSVPPAFSESTPTPEPVRVVPPQEASTSPSQTLEDQNIFHLLGASAVTDQEKEAFLDELQQVIWEDFLENDVELLITDDEAVELKRVSGEKEAGSVEQQEAVVTYLEKLIPDLEEIMMEKALELKADMVKERLAGMREYFAGNEASLATLTQAEQQMAENHWHNAAETMNALSL